MSRVKALVVMILLMLFSEFAIGQINYQHFLNLGRMKIQKDDFIGSVNDLNIALNSNNKGFEAYFLRGVAKFNLGDYKGAEMDFSSTISLHPLYVRAYFFRGISRDRLYEYSHALRDFDYALEIDPKPLWQEAIQICI